jgi:hypothetical protein
MTLLEVAFSTIKETIVINSQTRRNEFGNNWEVKTVAKATYSAIGSNEDIMHLGV